MLFEPPTPRWIEMGSVHLTVGCFDTTGVLVDIPVEHWQPERDGALSAETMARKLASYGFTFMQQVYGPGTVLSDHAHHEPTRDAIVSGHLQVI